MVPKQHESWIDHEIGRWLRETRLSRGLTQQQLGNLLGISYQQVQKYETATNRLTVSRLWTIAQALDVSPESLFLSTRYGHHVVSHDRAGHQAAGLARRIRNEELRRLWLELGEHMAQPTQLHPSLKKNVASDADRDSP